MLDFLKNCRDSYHFTTILTTYLTCAYSRIFFDDRSSLSGGVFNIEPFGKSGLVDGEKELSTLGSGIRNPFQISWFLHMSCCRTWSESSE